MQKTITTLLFLYIFLNSSLLKSHPNSFAELVEKLSPAVVSIASTTIVNTTPENQIPRFPQSSSQSPGGA